MFGTPLLKHDGFLTICVKIGFVIQSTKCDICHFEEHSKQIIEVHGWTRNDMREEIH